MVQIQNSIDINRPVNEVFRFVTDPLTTHQWQKNIVQTEILTPTPQDVGTQVREVRRIGSSESSAIWEVTAYDPPVLQAYRYPHGFGPFQQHGQTTFAAIPGGTRLHFIAVIAARFPLNLLLPFLAKVMQQQNQKNFLALKQALEMQQEFLSSGEELSRP
jgi:uncharacterized protein YndB with AHSA1/START domain